MRTSSLKKIAPACVSGRTSRKRWMVEYIAKKYDGRCAYCGGEFIPESLTVDHLQPLANGGNNEPWNLMPACRDCNAAKSDSSIRQFRFAIICQFYANLCGRFQNGRIWNRLVRKFGSGPVVFWFEEHASSLWQDVATEGRT
jgi:hypothetical protein